MPTTPDLIRAALADARPYANYREHLTELLAEGRTPGPNQGQVYLDAAHINQSRMDRLDRRPRLTDELAGLLAERCGPQSPELLFLVLTEGWCGDAAQTVPVMHWVAGAAPAISMALLLRHRHPDLMAHFLTDGAESIPKLIVVNPATHEVLADWGPRPAPAQEIAMRYKRAPEPKPDYDKYQKELHTWYARDKTRTTQAELRALLAAVGTGGPAPR